MDISRLRNRCDRNQLRSYFLWTTSIKSAMLSLENYKLLSVFACRADLFRLQHFQNAFFSRHKYESNRMILYFLWSLINALGFFKNDIKYFSILNFYENDSQFQNIPPPSMQGVEKHLWPPVKVCSHVHIFTWNQPQKVGTQQKPGPELGQRIWGQFFPQKTQKIHFYPALSIVHYLIFKISKLHQEFLLISFFS